MSASAQTTTTTKPCGIRLWALAIVLGAVMSHPTPARLEAQTPPSPVPASPSAAQSLLDKARALELRGRIDLAEQTWQQILLTDPKNPEALAGLARAAKLNHSPTLANSYLERLRAINPNDPNLVQVQNVTASKPDQELQLQQAVELAKAGDYANAMIVYRHVFGSTPPSGDWALAYYETEAATEDGRHHAVAGLRALLDKDPGNTQYRIGLGRILTYDPQPAKRVASISPASQRTPRPRRHSANPSSGTSRILPCSRKSAPISQTTRTLNSPLRSGPASHPRPVPCLPRWPRSTSRLQPWMRPSRVLRLHPLRSPHQHPRAPRRRPPPKLRCLPHPQCCSRRRASRFQLRSKLPRQPHPPPSRHLRAPQRSPFLRPKLRLHPYPPPRRYPGTPAVAVAAAPPTPAPASARAPVAGPTADGARPVPVRRSWPPIRPSTQIILTRPNRTSRRSSPPSHKTGCASRHGLRSHAAGQFRGRHRLPRTSKSTQSDKDKGWPPHSTPPAFGSSSAKASTPSTTTTSPPPRSATVARSIFAPTVPTHS